ncbi:MAG: hypothetical protein K2X55_12740 [Burkholderiaceae bacterium]|nr:hypothetical protein [Burkholderiaceae bacterium]
MEERTFFESGDVKVTNARFISGGQTFAMNNVTSVKPFEQKPSRVGGILLLGFGLIVMVSSFFVGLVIAGLAAYFLYQQKTIYQILLATSAGETKALVTHERDYLDSVITALNDAIIYRG